VALRACCDICTSVGWRSLGCGSFAHWNVCASFGCRCLGCGGLAKTCGHAVDRADMYIKVGSNTQIRKTTKCWHLCVEWKDGTESWERLTDLKESNPVEVAEYAATKNLHDDPDCDWWIPHVLKK
jgi:hypothetical protein